MSFDNMHATGGEVRFPYAQALELARTLWALAVQIDSARGTRNAAATVALEGWEGKFAEVFRQNMTVSDGGAQQVSADLQMTAKGLAMLWAKASYQEQLNIYAHEVQKKRDENNNFLGHFHDFVFGADLGSRPHPPEIPQPPHFEPTPVPQARVP